MNLLEVDRLSRVEDGIGLVKDISFTQQAAQKLALSGATGSGKTTLLKMIAGLVQPTGGTVLLAGEKVQGPEEKLLPGHPSIAYLSQHFELRNHYRVEEVLSMASRLPADEAQAIYAVCRVTPFLKRWTYQLSGGEKQRIALARLLVAGPRLLLLDEPYSNLDPFHKNMLKKVVDEIGESLNISCILVSHDPFDALSWADEILILKMGRLLLQGTPHNVYRYPGDDYTAALFGKFTQLTPVLAEAFSAFTADAVKTRNPFIRPESFNLVQKGEGVKGEVQKVSFMGGYYEADIMIGQNKVIVHTASHGLAKGGVVYVSLNRHQ